MRDVLMYAKRAAATMVAALLLTAPALGQTPSTQPPYNNDLGAVITFAAQVPATINSAQLNNLDKVGALCTLNISAESGSPSVTFSIQNFDTASNTYQTAVVSSSINAFATPTTIAIYPGIQTSSLPTNWSAAQSLPLARFWRVQAVVAGANTTTTGTIGCKAAK